MNAKKNFSRTVLTLALTSLLSISTLATTGDQLTFDNGAVKCSCGEDYLTHLNELKDLNPNARYLDCGCGGKIHPTVTYQGSWGYNGNSKSCSHYVNGHDYELEQLIVTKYKYGSCSVSWEDNGYKTKWECKGF